MLGRAVVVVDLPQKDLVRSWRKGLGAAVQLGECQGHFGRFIKGLATSLGFQTGSGASSTCQGLPLHLMILDRYPTS